MCILLGASFGKIFTWDKAGVNHIYHFFQHFLRGAFRILSIFLPMIYDVLTRLQAVTSSHESAKIVNKVCIKTDFDGRWAPCCPNRTARGSPARSGPGG